MVLMLPAAAASAAPPAAPEPAWTRAHAKPPMTADETRAFMRRLAQFVFDHQMKRAEGSPQRGMIYEYLDWPQRGKADQFVQGEALDTMHDGAWFAAAMATAHRATGDPLFKEILTKWQLPFYLKMLNRSDELFSPDRNDAADTAHKFGKEHRLQKGEKGFVPYFWDDGGSVSLERRQKKQAVGFFECVDNLAAAGKPNPGFVLDGYSLGSSNHLAQDLGVMLQLAWLLLRESDDPADKALAAEVAEAARNLHECRLRHFGNIPMCVAPFALSAGDASLLTRVPAADDPRLIAPSNHFFKAFYDFKPGQKLASAGFADNQQYLYYAAIARHGGGLPRPAAFKLAYDALTEPLFFRAYCDDWAVPPGINRFDLHGISAVDGRTEDHRSDRKGPGKGPRPVGSRMGPQNMIICGWALQALQADPGMWIESGKHLAKPGDETIPLLHQGDDPGKSVAGGPAGLRLRAAPGVLRLSGLWNSADPVTLRIFAKPDGQGTHAVITLKPDRSVSAVNDKGETLVLRHRNIDGPGGAAGYEIEIPCTSAKGQKPWANIVEFGRFSIRFGDSPVTNLLPTVPADHVKAMLERELAGGLRTWEAVLDEYGYIPTGIGAGASWDRFSDTGGYAHLINAAAQWLLYLDGKRDWEMHRVPAVK
jgi:hypothetical protein